MSTEVAIPESVIVSPLTGEAKELGLLTNDDIRAGVEQMEALAAAVAEAKRKLAEEALRRKNAGAEVLGVEVSRRNTWRSGEVGAALDKLERDGKLPTDREFYLREETTFKAIGRNLNALADQLTQSGDLESAGVLLTARRQSIGAKVKA